VEIVIGTRGGSIEGTVVQNGEVSGDHCSDSEFRRNNPALYKRQVIPAPGDKVLLRGIVPGNYRIFAVPDTGETLPFRSPVFAARYESRAIPVTLQKGSTVGPIQIPLLSLER
jgi:hypothetical protein